jgi:hypothetical protein
MYLRWFYEYAIVTLFISSYLTNGPNKQITLHFAGEAYQWNTLADWVHL